MHPAKFQRTNSGTEGKITKTRSGSSGFGSGCRSRLYKMMARCEIKACRLPVLSFRRATELSGQPSRPRSRRIILPRLTACGASTAARELANAARQHRSLDTLTSVNEQGVNDPQVDQDEDDRPKRLSGDKQEIGEGLNAHEDDAEPACPGRPTDDSKPSR